MYNVYTVQEVVYSVYISNCEIDKRGKLMNIKQKKVLRIVLAFVMLIAIIVPVASSVTGKAASWTVNSCYQINTSAGLALKSSASDSSSTLATIPNGTMVYVVNINSSNWGYTAYNNKYGWIKLSDATRMDDAPETVAELQKRFDAVMSFFPTGSKWKGSKNNNSNGLYIKNNGWNGPKECFGYAAEVWRALFGTEMAMSYQASKKYIFATTSTMTLVGSSVNKDVNAMKTLLSKARCGDIIQGVNSAYVNSNGTTSTADYAGQHTMVVYSVASDGIYVCDANNGNHGGGSNGVVNKYFYTWDALYKERGGAISLYTSKEYPAEKALPIVGGNIVIKNSSGAGASEFLLQDKITFYASIENAKTVTYYILNAKTGKTVYEYTSANSSFTYAFSQLDNSSTSYSVYYVAKNAAGTVTSSKKNFTVKAPTVSISGGDISLEVLKTVSLKEKLSYSPSTSVKFAWTTADPTIAQVNSSGVVTAKKAGTTTVTVTMTYTGTSNATVKVTASIKVTVFNPKYTVSFDVNGGSGNCPSITVEKTKQYGTLPTPTKTGYQFAGWYTAKTGGTLISATSIVSISGNTTLYAHWTPNKYTVTLNGNGGTPSSPTYTATYDAALGTLPTATRPGYVFEGWFTEKTGGTKITSTTVYKTVGSTTYYAQWSLANFKIKFDAAGGSASFDEKTVTYTYTYGDMPTATRTGYEFGGWFTGKNGTGTQITSGSKVEVTADTTLYANWIANKYTVSFDSNTGVGTFESRTVVFGSPYGTLPTPTKSGYEFVGWYTEIDGGKLADSNTEVFVASNHTLYAHWEPGKFTVTFEPNGGQTPTDSKKVTYLTTYGTLPIPERVGYTFVGWFTSKVDGEQITESTKVEIVAQQTLYAQWSVNTYDISFDTGSESKFDSIRVTFDTAYGELPVPTKRGYTFVGWFTSEKYGTQKIDSNSILKIGENTTLYAHWQANTYKITFDPTMGSVDTDGKNIVFGSAYGILPTPERFGYEFLGWFTENGNNGNFIDENTIVDYDRDMVLYAHWSARRVIVTFDPNSGVCDEATRGYEFDKEYGSFPMPTKTGYTFLGWMQQNGEYLKAETLVDFIEDISVTAQWKANSYTIELDCSGGSFATGNELYSYTVTYDSVYPQLGTPTRYGYRFVGWQTEDADFAYSGEIVKITSSQKLKAQWASVLYVVELDPNGGSLEEHYIKVGYNQPYGELPVPIKNGYSFAGWVDENGKAVNKNSIYPNTQSGKLFALWTERIYEISFDANGGQLENQVILSVKYGQSYGELPIPTRTGYKFTRWVDEDGNAIHSNNIVEVANDTKYYAEWIPLVFDVEFDGNGSDMTVPPVSVTYGDKYNILPEIERNGYNFVGWFDGDGNLVTENSTVYTTESITLTARWIALEYTLVFDANGGDCDIDRIDFTFDMMGGGVPVPSKEGNIFVGWFDVNGDQLTSDVLLDDSEENLFTARWAMTEYNVYFNVQGVINSNLTKLVEYKSSMGMLPEVKVYGYNFVCWKYSDGKIATEYDVYTAVSDTVLYAELVPGEYIISFYADGGEPEFAQKTVVNGEVYGELPQTVRHGYVLMGWFTEDGVRITEDTVASLNENIEVYARWAAVESDTDGIFRNNSMLATSCEVFAGVDFVLLLLTLLRKKKRKSV